MHQFYFLAILAHRRHRQVDALPVFAKKTAETEALAAIYFYRRYGKLPERENASGAGDAREVAAGRRQDAQRRHRR